jgi:adenine-specific DNA-methyltransferase
MSKINILDDLQNQPNEKIEAIKKILPDCFDVDGNLIFEKLKEVLSQNFAIPDTERFTFNWAGKQKAREVAYKTYTEGTLAFDKTKSKNFETTKNLIIEGDNLQVLKLLKNSYKGKVKCIYIDPPYNTGQDFVYNDKFELDIKKYLIETGEIDQETGEQMADYIQKDDGKKHSKWLSFMYPRLMMAREMLREDGVIFVSIDDNEVHHLRLLMNEVFGEGYVEQYIWNVQDSEEGSFPKTASHTVRKEHEYIIAGFKDKISLGRYEEYRFKDRKDFSNPDNDPRGCWMSGNISRNGITSTTGSKYFTITTPTGIEYTRNWTISKEEYIKLLNDKRIHFANNGDGVPRIKIFQSESSQSIQSSIFQGLRTSITGKKEMKELFNSEEMFDFTKPIPLIKRILQISTKPNDLILDFFAGSGTTGQAVMELNQEEFNKQTKDGLLADAKPVGGRRFILVQLPEKIDEKKEAFKAGYKKISDITIERVKRAGEKYQNVDNGFKVLGLVDNPDKENLFNLKNVDDNLFIITHLALFYGYGLNYKIKKIAEKEIYLMKSEIEKTKDAIIILEKNLLTMQDIMLLVKNYGKEKYKFFSCDSALNIELTYNLLQHFQEKNVVVF